MSGAGEEEEGEEGWLMCDGSGGVELLKNVNVVRCRMKVSEGSEQ